MSERVTIHCDECGRLKQDDNHWLRMLVVTWEDGARSIVLGDTDEVDSRTWNPTEKHDLCGDSCFHRHISKLLKLPAPAGEDQT